MLTLQDHNARDRTPMTSVLGLTACLLYFLAAAFQFTALRQAVSPNRAAVVGLGIMAAVLHGIAGWQEVLRETGVAFGLFDMASAISLVVVTIVVLSALWRPLENLLVVILPFAAISLVLSLFTGDTYSPRTALPNGVFAHVLASVTAYGLLTVAAVQAVVVWLQDRSLRAKRPSLLTSLPPLQTMEALLFELLLFGVACLTFAVASGFLFIEDIFERRGMVHHIVITLASWIVFAVLIWGRFRLGWRGAQAARWAMGGFALLLLGYFGSKAVLELVLESA